MNDPTKKFAVLEMHIVIGQSDVPNFHTLKAQLHEAIQDHTKYFLYDKLRELTPVEYNEAQTVIDPKGSKIENAVAAPLAGFKDRELIEELRRRGYMKKGK